MGNKALLVIDIQEDYTGVNASENTRYKDADELVIRVNKIIGECKRNNILINSAILFKNESKREKVFEKLKELGVHIIL